MPVFTFFIFLFFFILLSNTIFKSDLPVIAISGSTRIKQHTDPFVIVILSP